MQHAKDLKRLASEASSKIEKKTNFDEATKLRGMIMSLGLVSRHTFIFCIESHVETQIYKMRTFSTPLSTRRCPQVDQIDCLGSLEGIR